MVSIKEKYGSTALITGASAGIGEAFAHRLAKEGCDIVIVARRKERLQQMAEELSAQYSVKVLPIAADLARAEECERVYNCVVENGWQVDILINNAGRGSAVPFIDTELQDQLSIIDLNCRGLIAMTHWFLPPLRERNRGAIINVGSTVVHFSPPNMATYTASKAFDMGFTKVLAGELYSSNIDLLIVKPGTTKTEFFQAAGAGSVPEDSGFSKARTPEQVVDTALASLGKKLIVIDGLGNTIVAKIMDILPASWVLKLMAGRI